jgi:copper transport protein
LVVALRASGVEPAWAAGMVRQASRGFLVAAPIVIVSGVVSTSVHIGGPGDLIDTAWGRTLLVKVGVAVAALALGWWHRGRLERVVESGLFRLRSLSFEGAAFVVALAATSVLVSLVPAEIALDRPFSERRTTPGGLVQLDVSPARGGSNDLHLAFLADATTDRPVDAVRVVISTEGLAERVVPVQQDGASHAFATAVSFGPPGTWRVVVTSVHRGQPETATFEVELR